MSDRPASLPPAPEELPDTDRHAGEIRPLAPRAAADELIMSNRCESGEWCGIACRWEGDASEMVLMEFFPPCRRDAHVAAGNRGRYPHNGALRIMCCASCAAAMVVDDGDWCEAIQ